MNWNVFYVWDILIDGKVQGLHYWLCWWVALYVASCLLKAVELLIEEGLGFSLSVRLLEKMETKQTAATVLLVNGLASQLR